MNLLIHKSDYRNEAKLKLGGGRQQNPEHGTFRNIPEQGKLSQKKWKNERKRSKKQPKNKQTNKFKKVEQ